MRCAISKVKQYDARRVATLRIVELVVSNISCDASVPADSSTFLVSWLHEKDTCLATLAATVCDLLDSGSLADCKKVFGLEESSTSRKPFSSGRSGLLSRPVFMFVFLEVKQV